MKDKTTATQPEAGKRWTSDSQLTRSEKAESHRDNAPRWEEMTQSTSQTLPRAGELEAPSSLGLGGGRAVCSHKDRVKTTLEAVRSFIHHLHIALPLPWQKSEDLFSEKGD